MRWFAPSSWFLAGVLAASLAQAQTKGKPRSGKARPKVAAPAAEIPEPPPTASPTAVSPSPPVAPGPGGSEVTAHVEAPASAPRVASLKPRLAVLGVDAKELSGELRASVEEVLSQGVAELAGIEVVTAADLRAVLQLSQVQQLLGCDDERCAALAGDLLAVQQVVSGSVRAAGDRYVITVQRFDLVNGQSLGRQTVETAAEPGPLLEGVRRAVPTLFGVAGRIVLWEQPADAEVFVNGRLVGRTPVEPVVVKNAGTQDVAVLGPGLIPWKAQVALEPGQDLRLRVRADSVAALEAEAGSRRHWGWGLAGGAGALAVVAGGLYYLAYDNDRSLDRLDLRTTPQDRLDAITSRTLGLVVGAVVTGLAALALGGTGTYLLVDNPAAAVLDAHAGDVGSR